MIMCLQRVVPFVFATDRGLVVKYCGTWNQVFAMCVWHLNLSEDGEKAMEDCIHFMERIETDLYV